MNADSGVGTHQAASGPAPRFSYALAFLERSVRKALSTALTPHRLSVAQYTVLSLLAGREGLSNAQLARRAYITPQAMSEVLRFLEGRGLLYREPSPDHARIHPAHLTDMGREMLAACDAAVDRMEDVMLASLPEDERRRMIEVIMRCARDLGYPSK